ncbi:hypothetical protein [Rhizobium sp. BK176]|uniref:hypothetical protein n=1 Tax=Rhizobium sp. BK176 TaxID=2587071 RepID=UPI002166FD29|nr:hypothetical protein [Rhizobium sp. BK176]MCS4089063.1 hypothetical protein [Rhizobium sp. BK176]
MTALQAFASRNAGRPSAAVVAAMIGVGFLAAGAAGMPDQAKTIPTHSVSADEPGAHLVQAASARVADQISDMKRVILVIDAVADLPISGADKMRDVTKSFNEFARLTPDGGAKEHDKQLFAVTEAMNTIEFEAAVEDLNKDKMDLARATFGLRNVQYALLTGNEQELAENLDTIETSIARYEARHPEKEASASPDAPDAIHVAVNNVKQNVPVERKRIFVTLDR